MLLTEAAVEVGVSAERLRQLAKAGRLEATQHGRFWMVRRSALERFKKQPRVRTGRPPKPKAP